MSAIDYILLGVAVFVEVIFFSLFVYIRVTRPVFEKVGRDNILQARDAWVQKVDRIEKTVNPVVLHSIAGTALLGWVVYRIILSFI